MVIQQHRSSFETGISLLDAGDGLPSTFFTRPSTLVLPRTKNRKDSLP